MARRRRRPISFRLGGRFREPGAASSLRRALSVSTLEWRMETWVLPALLGLGLAASAGLKTFVPLLVMAVAARFHLFGVELSDAFAWLGSWAALVTLSVATVAEVSATRSRLWITRSACSARWPGPPPGPWPLRQPSAASILWSPPSQA
jgi:hypothetical protein